MLEIEYLEVETLIKYANNSRVHSDKQIKQISNSIKEFGFTNPVLIDENNVVIAGHGRLMASKKLNIESVPCIRLKGLSDAQKKAYAIADNAIADNAGWDIDILKSELDILVDLDFDLSTLALDFDVLGLVDMVDVASIEEQGALDKLDPKYITCPNCGKEFDMRKQ